MDIWHLFTATKTVSWDVESHLWWEGAGARVRDAMLKLGSPLCAELALELNFWIVALFITVIFSSYPFPGE